MEPSDLRIALFTGNYNYVRDGANQALNRLVDYLLRQGAAVRVYSPTVEHPALEPNCDIVSVPSIPVPGRAEYHAPLLIPPSAKRDIRAFRPNIFHIASPEILGHRAVTMARKLDIPVVASVHTRFETYFRYYHASFLEPVAVAILRRLYRRCDAIFAPSDSMAQELRHQRMNYDIGIWTRGVDHTIFNPGQRDMAWRRGMGLADDVPVIGFVGRIVMEKGLDVFAETIDRLKRKGVAHRVLVVGQGPARDWFERRLCERAVFAGHQTRENLGRAVASMDMLFNPSDTETFGNVTLEAMAAGLPVVAARATGSQSLVTDGVTGRLVEPGNCEGFADALAHFCGNEDARRAAGEAGHRFSRQFAWDEVNQRMVDGYLRVIYQRAIGRQPGLVVP